MISMDFSGYQHCLGGLGGGGGFPKIHNHSTTKLMATGHRYLENTNVHCKHHFWICLRKYWPGLSEKVVL